MALTALNPEKWKRMAQAFRNKMLVARAVCNTQFPEVANSGDTVNFPYLSDLRRESYVGGTDVTFYDDTATQDALVIDQREVVTFSIDPAERKQAEADYEALYAEQAMYQLGNSVDQLVINSGITNATGSVTGGTVSSTTIFTVLSNSRAALARQNAGAGGEFAIIDPERLALIEQNLIANGFNVADSVLKNGYSGRYNGFDIYVSNNLPSSVDYTMDTINVAGETFTVLGVAFEFVASGTAAAAGEISIGANVAANKANFLLAINGTGTPGAATYIDVSKPNRDILSNARVSAGAFSGDVSTITGYGKLLASTDSTAGANGVGTETTSLLTGKYGAISLAMQMQPNLYQTQDPDRPGVMKCIAHQLYGYSVYQRDKARLCAISINV